MRVLLDTGILAHAEIAIGAVQPQTIEWGTTKHTVEVHGFARKASQRDPDYQKQIDALFTVGRLIREGRITAYDSWEIRIERNRGYSDLPVCNALWNCRIALCSSPLERSKFRMTRNITDWFAKGGKKDRRAGVELGSANQLAFLSWLCSLTKDQVEAILSHARLLKLSQFEMESLRDIGWFQHLCRRAASEENFPDVFHLWTAKRSGLDAFLTLERKLPNIVSSVEKERRTRFKVGVEVFRPLELLNAFGITELDPVPMEFGRFYGWFDVPQPKL